MKRLLVCGVALAALFAVVGPESAPAGSVAPVLRVRKDIKDLTPQEKADFVAAILKLKQTPSPWNAKLSYYDQFVWWHRQSFLCTIMAAHMSSAFLPWHREFLLLFENALRQVSGKPITIPYWDWTDPNSTAAVFAADFMGGPGVASKGYAVMNGPFRKGAWRLNVVDPKASDPRGFHYLVRRFATPIARTLPTATQITTALTRPSYDVKPYDAMSSPTKSFRNYLEGWREVKRMTCEDGLMGVDSKPHAPHLMHNGVHLWVGGIWGPKKKPFLGTMTLNTSLNDPVFWLHHANIDRLWSQWEQIHGEQYRPVSGARRGQNLHDTMWPYRNVGDETTIADLLDIDSLGYTYAAP
ncbi:MAG TPA: tyrosinase family protein [Gaiellaceae bacterium]